MTLEDMIIKKIETLDDYITTRNNSKKEDYVWNFSGLGQVYYGRLQALREVLHIIIIDR